MPTLRSLALLVVPLLVGAPLAAAPQWSSEQRARIYPDPNDLALGDTFGAACALDGTTLVVGAPWHDGGGVHDRGGVYVFVEEGARWVQEAALVAATQEAGDRAGYSVAIEGDTAVVGAPFDETAGFGAAGTAYVFVRQGGAWTEQAQLLASTPGTFHHFGIAVAIAGERVVVGAPRTTAGGIARRGAAYVYVQSGSVWTQEAELLASDAASDDDFGRSVAIDGDTIVIGAPGCDSAGATSSGALYVYELAGGAWSQTAKLAASDAAAGDRLGASVALDADTIVGGAPDKDGTAGFRDGAAYVFACSSAVWAEQAKLTDFGAVYHDEFGTSVDVEGDRVVVGLPLSALGGIATGAVQLFTRRGAAWSPQIEMIGSDSEGNDYLGTSVALSGDLVASGAPHGETPPSGQGTGEAYVFALVPPPRIESYCTAKTNSLGCAPTMSWTGVPSASNPQPFTLHCSNVVNWKSGMLFYGFAEASVPFQGGTLCVAPPHRRTSVQHSGGTPPPAQDCSGTFSLDMNERIQSGSDAALVPGALVHAQYWSRDPLDAFATSLSDAVLFEIVP